MAKRRSYEQYCPLARAMDVLGERWTLLIVRELIPGPKRYGDLQRGLPGMATDLLTARLRALEDAGIVSRWAPSPRISVYKLTDRGRELEPAVMALARFGLGMLSDATPPDGPPPPERFELMLRLLFRPGHGPREPETWVFEGGGATLAVTADSNGFQVRESTAYLQKEPTARFIADPATLYELVTGRLHPRDALEEGRVEVVGDPSALFRMRDTFPTPEAAAA